MFDKITLTKKSRDHFKNIGPSQVLREPAVTRRTFSVVSGFSSSILLIHANSSGVHLESQVAHDSWSWTSSPMTVNTAGQYAILGLVDLRKRRK